MNPILARAVFPVALMVAAPSFSIAQVSLQASERVQALFSKDRPLVIAHRGYSMAAPENTIPAFELGLLAHSDLVEFDYFHCRDGIPVVFHDRTLDRTTDAVERWGEEGVRIESRPYSDLKELDAGSWFSPKFAGVPIPTVEESLEVIQPGSVALVERKDGDAKTIVELLDRMDFLNDVVIQAFDWEFLTDCHELAPHAALGALGPPRRADGSRYPYEERFLNTEFLDRIEETGAVAVGWNRQVTPEAIEEAQERGLHVWIYTINELNTAVELLNMGVDGIITDNPPMAWKAVVLHLQGRGE